MKKIKKRFIKGVLIVCVLSLFSSAVLWYEPTKKVKAAEPSILYMSYEVNYPNQITFIIYVLDAYQDITTNTCALTIYGNYYENYAYDAETISVQFLKNNAYKNGDYNAYIYIRNVTTNEINRMISYRFQISSLRFDNSQLTTSYYGFTNLMKIEESRINGYDEGVYEGRIQGRYEAYDSLEPGEEHYDTIYRQGYNSGESSQIDTNFMEGIFTNLDAFFGIHIAPFLTIGELVLAPLIIWFVWFIIKQFKGGD